MPVPPPVPSESFSAAGSTVAAPSADLTGVSGSEGLSSSDIAREIYAGGRFVYYPWCVSIAVMTFRRGSSVRFLRANEDGFGAAIGYSLISLCFGWWGLPWGLIWTPMCLFQCLTGGKDVTREILTQVGGDAAAQLLREAPKRRRSLRMWLLPVGFVLFLFFGFPLLVHSLVSEDERPAPRSHGPGAAQFDTADRFVAAHRGTSAGGNTEEARKIAEKISAQMKSMRDALFTRADKKSSGSLSHNEFLTWCQLDGNRAVVLIHVPDLRNFEAQAKESLAQLAWGVSRGNLVSRAAVDRPLPLAVATRGAVLYDRMLVGKVASADSSDDAPSRTAAVEGSSTIQSRLESMFAPAATAQP